MELLTIDNTPSLPPIALDIDGVIKEFSDHFLNYLGFEDKSDPNSWDDPRFRDNFHKIANDNDFWLSVPDIFSPSYLMFKPVCYVTARPCPTHISAMSLFHESNFPFAKIITVGMNNSKVDAVKESGALLVLDDAIHNFEELNENGVNCLLVTRSHNKGYDEPHVSVGGRRVDSLLDFQDLFFDYDGSNWVFDSVLYRTVFGSIEATI